MFRTGGGTSAPDMQWEGFSGWNGLLGIWGWSRNGPLGIEERPLGGRQQGKGVRNGNRAFGVGGSCSKQAGRSEWEQGAWIEERALRVEAGMLRADEGKAVRGAV